MRPLTLLLLVLLPCAPGCLTAGLWSWARDEADVTHAAVAIASVTTTHTSTFKIRIRMADGVHRVEWWRATDWRAPLEALDEARAAARAGDRDAALEALGRAVRRGLLHRGFREDPDLRGLADAPELARLDEEPVTLPRFELRPHAVQGQETATGTARASRSFAGLALPSAVTPKPVTDDEERTHHADGYPVGCVDLVHLAPPEAPEVVAHVAPVKRRERRGGLGSYLAAGVLTLFVAPMDGGTVPFQLAIALLILDEFSDLFHFFD